MKEVLRVEHLCKSYQQKCAVHDISFHLLEGECFGLLGHNGAGKTTTLECILQVKKYDSGEIHLLNDLLHGRNLDVIKRGGVQLQDSTYPEKMKVKEACELYASLYEHTLSYETLLERFQLATKKGQLIAQLSGGERQRLSVLLAMLHQPKILFLDELTTGLDPQARKDIWQYLQAYKQQGNSILLTSHSMEEVEALCDRIAILKEGHFIFHGSVAEAKRKSQCATMEEAYLWFQEENR